MSSAGKGSARRPLSTSEEEFDKKFTNIFKTKYCLNCRKVTNVEIVSGEVRCQSCLRTVSFEKPKK